MLQKSEMGPSTQSTRILTILTVLISAAAILAIGLLVFVEDSPTNSFLERGEFFWQKLIWCEVLFFSGWYFGLQRNFKNLLEQRQQTGGAIPALSSAILGAVFLSYAILLVSLFLPNERIYDVLLLVAQIIIIVICMLKLMVLNHARHLQNDGVVPIPDGIKVPNSLVAQLVIIEKTFSSNDTDVSTRIKTLREKIKYSLPLVGKIANSESYIILTQKVDKLSELGEMRAEKIELFRELDEIERTLSMLIVELNN